MQGKPRPRFSTRLDVSRNLATPSSRIPPAKECCTSGLMHVVCESGASLIPRDAHLERYGLKGPRAPSSTPLMPAKSAASARVGSGATKRRVKSTAKRQYPPPKNMMIRAPGGPPVDATVEDTVSDADSDDSDTDMDLEDSASESFSMEIDEDTGEKVTTGRPLGRAKELVFLKTTRYEYPAATVTFVDGRKHRVVPGTCVVVNFFDETANDRVTSCPALVRTIFSVEKNNQRDRSLNGEATVEEVNRDGVLLGVSWLLDATQTKKLEGGKEYEPPCDIPTNERFYDPRSTSVILPAHISEIVPSIVFLARRRNASGRPAYPDPESGAMFVNKIIGSAQKAIVTRPIGDDDFDDATKEHFEHLLEMHAPRDEDDPPAARPREAARVQAEKISAAASAPEEKRERGAEPQPAHPPARAAARPSALADGSKMSRENQLERRAERAERRVDELEAKLKKAEKEIERARAAAEAMRLAAARAGTPQKGSSGAFFSPATIASVTLERLNALAQQCKTFGPEDEADAAAGEFSALLVADAEKLVRTATSLERRIHSRFPRDRKLGQSRVVRELAAFVRGPDPFASRLLLGELDATRIECLRVEAERAAAKEKKNDASDVASDDDSDDDSDDASDDECARAPAIPAGRSATDSFGLTETQKRNLSVNPTAPWRANPAQLEFLEARFAERLAAGEAVPKITRDEGVKQTLELARLGPILEQKVKNWWANRRMKQRKLDALAATRAA